MKMNAVYGFLLMGCLWRPAAPLAAQPATSSAINLLPRYGNAPKSAQLLRADAAFLAFCDKSFPTRKAAVAHVAARGWDFLRAGEVNTAIKRFNQAWLLDSTHAGAYWGFGAIMGQRQQAGESLKYLLLSQRYDSTNKQLLVDLALTRLNLYAETKQLAEVDRAIAGLRRYLADPG